MISERENLGGLVSCVCLLIAFGFVRVLAKWIQDAPATPDPWGRETQEAVDSPDLPEVCHHCSASNEPTAWFCGHCGSAIGPYNNLMPYVNAFSQGEVFRNGVCERMRANPLILVGYVLVSLEGYLVFAPLYWFFLARNLFRTRPPESEDPESPAG
jgi:ribosomal protein L40E